MRQILENLPEGERATVFVDAGPWEELVARILARGPMSEEDIARRRAHYEQETAFKEEADFVVSNRAGERESAQDAFIAIVRSLAR